MFLVMAQGVSSHLHKPSPALRVPFAALQGSGRGDREGGVQERNFTPFSLIATTTTTQPKNLKRGVIELGDSLGTGKPWPLSKQQLATWCGIRLH